MHRRCLPAIVLVAGLCGTPALAQLADENVLVKLPRGFKPGFERKTATIAITEYVRQGETADDWTEMISSQIFFANREPPGANAGRIQQIAASVCAANESTAITTGAMNGYPFATWVDHCPMNAKTGKTEWTVFKIIGGHDASYLVTHAFRFEPSTAQLKEAIEEVHDSFACDTRTTEHACPVAKR